MLDRRLVILALLLAALFGGYWFGRGTGGEGGNGGGETVVQCPTCCRPDRTWRPRRDDSTLWGPVGTGSGTCSGIRAMCDSASPEGSCAMFRLDPDSASGDTTPRQ